MSRESGSVGLPETLDEFGLQGAADYDPAAVDRLADHAADLSYGGRDGNCPYDRERHILTVRDPDAIVLGYSVTHRIAGEEDMAVAGRDAPDGHETARAMIDHARDPDRGGTVPVYLPTDTRSLLYRNTGDGQREIGRFVDELEAMTEPLPVDRYRDDAPGSATGKTSAGQVATIAALNEVDGEPVIATYNNELRPFTDSFGGISTAPWQILEGMALAEGPYETDGANRIAGILERFTEPTDYREDVADVPDDLRGDLPRGADVVAPDHSVTGEIGDRQRRQNEYGDTVHTWKQALHGIDAAAAADDIAVALPENAGPRIEDTIGGAAGRAVREELERMTVELELDLTADVPPEMGDVPDAERERKAEDYAIAAGAVRMSDSQPLALPVVMTYDDDFADMDGVVARDPSSVGDALRSRR